jgi:hypothetical protein
VLFFTPLSVKKPINPCLKTNKGHPMNHVPNPAITFIKPKDAMPILQLTYHGAYKHLQKIKDSLGKLPRQYLTVKEFAEWEGLDPHVVLQTLNAA